MLELPEIMTVNQFVNVYEVHTLANGTLSFSPRPHHGLVFYLSGSCDYYYLQNSYTALPNCLLFLPKGQPYGIVPHGKSDCLCINFHCDEMIGRPSFIINPVNTATVQALFEKSVATWNRHESGHVSKCISYLYAILSELQRDLDGREAGHPGITQLKKAYVYIHGHYKEPDLRVPFLASECNMSERSFRSKFEEIFGVSPVKYITNLRMTYARDLLSSRMIPVSEVAARCGYKDIYYFSRVFKQYYGVSPSLFMLSL